MVDLVYLSKTFFFWSEASSCWGDYQGCRYLIPFLLVPRFLFGLFLQPSGFELPFAGPVDWSILSIHGWHRALCRTHIWLDHPSQHTSSDMALASFLPGGWAFISWMSSRSLDLLDMFRLCVVVSGFACCNSPHLYFSLSVLYWFCLQNMAGKQL